MRKLLNTVAVLVLAGVALMLWLPLLPVPVQESVTRLVDGARRIGSGESAGEASPTLAAGGGQRLSTGELDELRVFALGLINSDRADHGVPPVAMGSNPAAQLHAEDMLTNQYLGHWWVDGAKPYMVYTETGGTSYVAENVAIDGWTSERWRQSQCDALLVACTLPVPDEAVSGLQWAMMYDDAGSDWGHRDNILRPEHRSVNLGIAWNGRLLTFAQHFEGGDVEASGLALTSDGLLSLSLRKRAPGTEIAGVVSVYYDPLPVPRTPAEIGVLHSYCVGGGFTTECGQPIARVLVPPGTGRFYPDLDPGEVVASVWRETALAFELRADLGALAREPGVYTIQVWRDSGRSTLTESLLQLSAFQR